MKNTRKLGTDPFTKGPKRQQPVKDAIEDEEQQIKGHTKEMRQKWPNLCKKYNIW